MYTDMQALPGRKGDFIMREWTREEKYRYLKDPQELSELYEKISASVYRQHFHNQAVTGLMNDPNGFVWHDNRWHLSISGVPGGQCTGSSTGIILFPKTL